LAPADDTCDVVAAALTITPERAEAALFTDPYFTSAQSLMVLQSRADELTGLDALAGLTIGAISGSTGAAYADANAPDSATVVGFANGDLLYAALDGGEVDAVVRDLPLNISRFNSEPDKYALVGEFDTGEQYGFAVAKGNTALADALNQQLKRVKADGTYQKIYDQYFTLASTTTAP
jgi:polar amino acid transport system substrate-binding protein